MKPRNKLPFVMVIIAMMGLLFGSTVSAQRANFQSPILVVNTSFLNVRTGPSVQFSVLTTVVGGTELPVLGIAPDGVWYQVNTNSGVGWVNRTFTIPRGTFATVPVIRADEVGAVNLGQGGGESGTADTTSASSVGTDLLGYSLEGRNILSAPSFDASIVATGVPVDPSVIYPLQAVEQADGITWYFVDVPNIGTGWTDAVSLRLLACSEEVYVTNRDTQISFDGISDNPGYVIPPGTEGYLRGFRGTSNYFALFQLSDGSTGLVPGEILVPRQGVTSRCDLLPAGGAAALGQGGGATETGAVAQPQLSGNRVVVNTGNLNIRSGPSVGFNSIATVPGGTELAVIGRAPDDVWYFVEGDFGRGWLNRTFTIFRGSFGTVPVINDPTIVVTDSETSTTTDTGDTSGATTTPTGQRFTGVSLIGKNLYAQPDYDSVTVNSAIPDDPNTVYPLLNAVTSEGVTWYLVDAPNIGRGWTDGVTLRPLGCYPEPVGVLQRDAQITFDGFSDQAPFFLPTFTEGYILGYTGINSQFAIFEIVGDTVGLVPGDALADRQGVRSVCDGINTTSTATANLGQGGGGAETTTAQPAVSGNRVVINTGNLNVRSGPNAAFGIVTTLPGGTEVPIVGRTSDGFWYLIETSAGRGWVNSEFVVFRGVYSTVPVVNL